MLLFFIPDAKSLTGELRRQHGLDRLVQSPQSRETFSGPGGVPGLIVADGDTPAERVAYRAEQQTWSKRYGMTSQVGTWNDLAITPDQLVRRQAMAGTDVQLLDSQHWTVPILRSWKDGDSIWHECQLPRVMQQCAETGSWLITAVVPQYRELWDESLEIGDALFDQLRTGSAAELEWSRVFAFACKLLAVNYRIDASVLSHLQLLQPDLAAEIVRAALDWDTLRAHLKNRLSRLVSGGTSTESGATPPTEG
jgi:hypothetical protein